MKDFFTHVEDVAYTALQLYFLAVANYMEEDKEEERTRVLTDEFCKLLEKINHFSLDLRQIYKSLLLA